MIWILAVGLMILAIIIDDRRRPFYEGRTKVYFNDENDEINFEEEYSIRRSLVRPRRLEHGKPLIYDQEADAKAQEEIEMLETIWRLPYNQ